MNEAHKRELYETFERHGYKYFTKRGRYCVYQDEGSVVLSIVGTAESKNHYVYASDPLTLSEAIEMAEKWDAEEDG